MTKVPQPKLLEISQIWYLSELIQAGTIIHDCPSASLGIRPMNSAFLIFVELSLDVVMTYRQRGRTGRSHNVKSADYVRHNGRACTLVILGGLAVLPVRL